MTRVVMVVIALAAMAGALPARAQSACARQVEADALETQGVALRDQARHAEALALFRRSYALCQAPRALGRTGLAEGAVGQLVEAEEHIQQALASRGDAWVEAHRHDLDEDLARVVERLGTLELTGEGPAAEVTIDGQARGRWPAQRTFRVPAGRAVQVVVRSPGCRAVARSATVAARAVLREAVALTCEAAPSRSNPRRTLAWVSAGAAAVTLGVGVVGLGVYLDRLLVWNDDSQCFPANGAMRRNNCSEAWSGLLAGRAVAVAGFGLAAALGATSLVLFATMPAESATGGRVALRCGLGPGELGVACGGVF
jgi:tetratricopeptide (TPR) repeat protein